MRCRNCGKECKQISAKSIKVGDGVYQTSRCYKCPKCGKKYGVTDEPHKVN